MDIFAGFRDFVNSRDLFRPSDRILLTVSGGLDSAVMAELFHMAGFDFGIAHCNFQLRGEESEGDEMFVKQMAVRLKVPFYNISFQTQEYLEIHKVSTQVAARQLRYDWFEKIRSEQGYAFIATAHHLQDAAETILLNLTKGTGLAGLHGISCKRGFIIRPLLFTNREGIAEFAALNQIQYRTDSSNSQLKYERNKIRKLVLPVLREINPALERTFFENAERIKGYEAIISNVIGELRNKLFTGEGDIVRISISGLLELQPPETYLFELLKPFNFTQTLVEEIVQSYNSPPGRQFFSTSHRLVKDREFLLLEPVQAPFEEFEILPDHIEKGGLKKFSRLISLQKHAAEGFEFNKPEDTVCLDFHKLEFPLRVRTWRSGDFFYPLGMQGKKKLSDFFTDKKLSLIEKERCWIFESGGKIAWVAGYRMDGRFKIEPGSREVLTIRISDE